MAIALGFGLALSVAAPVRAFAQQDPGTRIIPSLELQQADVRDALRALFRNVNVNYSIAPEVQGTVTVSMKNVLFEQALQNVLKQVDATYRIEGGVYEIVKREVAPPPGGGPQTAGPLNNGVQKVFRRIYIQSADPQFIFRMIRGSIATNISPEISQGRSGGGQSGGIGGSGGSSGGSGGIGGGSSGGGGGIGGGGGGGGGGLG